MHPIQRVFILLEGDHHDYKVRVYDAEGTSPLAADVAQQVLVLIREFAA